MKKNIQVPEGLSKLQRIKGSADDKRANLEFLNEQRRLADDFSLFMYTALHRGYNVEIVAIVDGQTAISSLMVNGSRERGAWMLEQIYQVANYERLKILSQIEGFMSLPDKGEAGTSP